MKRSGRRTQEFIEDVAVGISDEALMAKYRITGRRFFLAKAAARDVLARQKADPDESKPMADLWEVLEDIRQDVSNDALMSKYNLTSRQLQTVFRELINADLATPLELSGRLSMTTSQVVEAFDALGMVMGGHDGDDAE